MEKQRTNMEDLKSTNIAIISGVLKQDFELSHTCHNEEFFSSVIAVTRKSGTIDNVPIIVSGDFLTEYCVKGKYAEVKGSVRMKGVIGTDGKSHLKVFVFVDELNICDDIEGLVGPLNRNFIYLEALIWDQPYLKKTPLGRTICNFMVKTQIVQTYYIPCIAWSKLAHFVKNLTRGDKLVMVARFQSRIYIKNGEEKETYEMSIASLM